MSLLGGLVGGGLSLAGGLLGSNEASKDRKAAEEARRQALDLFRRIELPNIEDQKLNLETLDYVGDYNPLLEQAINLQDTELASMSEDPVLRQLQMESIDQTQQRALEGMTPEDEAALRQVRRNAAGEAQAMQGQILQEMAARGQGGSGAELIARLQAQQAATDRMSQEGDREAQMRQQMRAQAANQLGNMAGQLRSQDFSQDARIAEAKDAVNRFNTQNQINRQQRNVGSQNQAQMSNLDRLQAIKNQNAAIRNQQQMNNKGLIQQQFQNEMQRAGGMTGQLGGIAQSRDAAAGRTGDMYARIGTGLGRIASDMFKTDKDKGEG